MCEKINDRVWLVHLVNIVLIILLTVAVYATSTGNGFVWDDVPVIVENPLFDGTHGIVDVLTAEDTIPGPNPPTGYYRPAAYLSFYIDRLMWGVNPAGFHVTSLFLHLAVAVALYFLLFQFFPSSMLPLLGALFFAINPVAVESVCLVTARNTILCSLFALLALLAHRKNNYVLAAVCMFAAAAAKESGFLIPLILIAHDRINGNTEKNIRPYLPHACAAACLILLRLALVPAPPSPPAASLLKSLLLTPELALRYLTVFLVPFQQKVAYPVSSVSPGVWHFCATATGMALIVFLLLRYHRSRLLITGLVWFSIFILPALLLAPLYKLPMSDRHAYLPMLGITMVLCSCLCRVSSRWLMGVLSPFILCSAVLSYAATAVWRDNGTLFERMVRDAPQAETGYTGLATHYFHNGAIDLATTWLDRGVKNNAISRHASTNMKINMMTFHAERLVREGRSAEAESLLMQALNINPDFVPALIDHGGILARRGNAGEAVRLFLRAVELQPENPVPYFNLSEAYRMMGDSVRANAELREYRRLTGER